MKALLFKDFRNALSSFGPACILGVPLLLILQFTKGDTGIDGGAAFWVTYFFSSTSIFYRSFAQERRFKNFQIYSAFRVPKLQIFFSQSALHFFLSIAVGAVYLALCFLFWSPFDGEVFKMMGVLALVSACLAPLGTLFGLMLQLEREFLFSVIYLPLATPVILGAHSISLDAGGIWFKILLSFGVLAGFLSALLFEFYFDELSQNL